LEQCEQREASLRGKLSNFAEFNTNMKRQAQVIKGFLQANASSSAAGASQEDSFKVTVGKYPCDWESPGGDWVDNKITCKLNISSGTKLPVRVWVGGQMSNQSKVFTFLKGACDSGMGHNDADRCQKCTQARYSDKNEIGPCKACKAGQMSQNSSGSTACFNCPAGEFGVFGKASCSKCPKGRYQGQPGQASCIECGKGEQSENDHGSVTCIACPAGTFSDANGTWPCRPCTAGQFGAETGLAACRDCQQHTFAEKEGLILCKECPAGKLQNKRKQPYCEDPPGNSYVMTSPNGEKNVKLCPLEGLNPEFTCKGGGILRYKNQGFWHDGLMLHSPQRDNEASPIRYLTDRANYNVTSATKFYRCPSEHSCQVNADTGDVECALGSEGVLCAACSKQFYRSRFAAENTYACHKCSGDTLLLLWPLFLLVFVLVSCGFVWIRWGHHAWQTWWARIWEKRFHKRQLELVIVAKIVLGFYQVLLLQPDVYDVPFPAIYLQYLDWMGSLAFVGFDLPLMFKLECIVDTDYHARVYSVACCSCLVLFALVFAMARARRQHMLAKTVATNRGRSKTHTQLALEEDARWRKMLSGILVLSYLVYPSSSSVFFQTFNCRTIDDVRYHTKDLRIVCDTPEHTTAEAVATTMIVLFAFGLPVLYLALLIPQRRQLVTSSPQGDSLHVNMGFFCKDYKPRFYWWEVVEVFRKLLLTGVLVRFEKGSSLQIVLAVSIIILHMVLLVHFKPYKKLKHTIFALFVYLAMLFVFFAGLLLSMMQVLGNYVDENEHTFLSGLSDQRIGELLVVALLSVLVTATVIVLDELRAAANSNVLKHGETDQPVVFAPCTGPSHYHLFLSHVWSSGQDQVQAIKKELQLLVPSMAIFLDVENLTDIGGLEKLIEGSDVTLFFLSEGYLESWNVLREVRHAISTFLKRACGIILVREPEKIHGKVSMDDISKSCPQHIGCAVHVKSYDPSCSECAECPVDIRGFMHNRVCGSSSATCGVIDWFRVKDYKIISLKLIVQQMLVAAATTADVQLKLRDELGSKQIIFRQRLPLPRVLVFTPMHTQCRLSQDARQHLLELTPGIKVTGIGHGEYGPSLSTLIRDPNYSSRLVVPVYDGVFEDKQAVDALQLALEAAIPVVLLHERDPAHLGCEFGKIFDACPSHIKGIRGHNGQKIFDPIAVAWVRGAHNDVSVRLLALSIGASSSSIKVPKEHAGKGCRGGDGLADYIEACGVGCGVVAWHLRACIASARAREWPTISDSQQLCRGACSKLSSGLGALKISVLVCIARMVRSRDRCRDTEDTTSHRVRGWTQEEASAQEKAIDFQNPLHQQAAQESATSVSSGGGEPGNEPRHHMSVQDSARTLI
jgi:hypothetical protein